jgi:hypothetical protein
MAASCGGKGADAGIGGGGICPGNRRGCPSALGAGIIGGGAPGGGGGGGGGGGVPRGWAMAANASDAHSTSVSSAICRNGVVRMRRGSVSRTLERVMHFFIPIEGPARTRSGVAPLAKATRLGGAARPCLGGTGCATMGMKTCITRSSLPPATGTDKTDPSVESIACLRARGVGDTRLRHPHPPDVTKDSPGICGP